MIIYNDNGNEIAAEFYFKYKGYDVSIQCDPCEKTKMSIMLDSEEVGVDPFDSTNYNTECTIPDAIEWIDEDIKCRIEEKK
jgi:hypothetical protein